MIKSKPDRPFPNIRFSCISVKNPVHRTSLPVAPVVSPIPPVCATLSINTCCVDAKYIRGSSTIIPITIPDMIAPILYFEAKTLKKYHDKKAKIGTNKAVLEPVLKTARKIIGIQKMNNIIDLQKSR